ncbi:MAG: NAD-dependent epimerase/dehydratase family protein [Anaerolineae bacterium]|nr:NAD-dependent epimerase/dehydratase family protein [Anaerolineae bacterium]
MKLLVLGGTQFVGRYIVQSALNRGHEVTIFNRGKTNADLFLNVERLTGDRGSRGSATDLSALRGREWDAVIDVNAYVPRQVREMIDALAGKIGHYTFISTVSVFESFEAPNLTEDFPLAKWPQDVDPNSEEITGGTYGPLKVACEQTVSAALPGHDLIVRPGLVIGPDDHTDRFTYWPVRAAQGGEMLLPGEAPGHYMSLIDARDLADFTIHTTEQHLTGAFNATGAGIRLGEVANISKAVSGSDVRFTWVSDDFLIAQEVGQWAELPLWLPVDINPNVSKVVQAGMNFRPMADTIRDILAWNAARPADAPRHFTFSPEREKQLLDAWHQQQSS